MRNLFGHINVSTVSSYRRLISQYPNKHTAE